MKLGDVLTESLIKVPLDKSSKEDIIAELIDLIVPTGKLINKENVLKAVQDREKIMSTGIGNAVAIPHGKSPDSPVLTVSMGVTKQDIDFESLDGKPVRIIFMLVGPEKPASDHIKMLSRISRLCNQTAFRKKIIESVAPAEILKMIRDEEALLES